MSPVRRPARPSMPMPAPTAPDDAEDQAARAWLRAAAGGDRSAFESLYRQLYPRLRRFLARLNTRHDQVDEAINDAMLVVWRRAGEFRGESRVSTWVTGIAYRCQLQALRRGAPAEEAGASTLDEADAAGPADDHDAAGRHELRDWLDQGLQRLPAEQRSTLLLAYVMGESCEDIAQIMGCPVGTVKARLFHARVRLRHLLPDLATAHRPSANGDWT